MDSRDSSLSSAPNTDGTSGDDDGVLSVASALAEEPPSFAYNIPKTRVLMLTLILLVVPLIRLKKLAMEIGKNRRRKKEMNTVEIDEKRWGRGHGVRGLSIGL
ncbi:CCR4-NOT transcription complex subunit 10-like protein [Corchorus capsularis]|uniref:CCR4-NOT transcription complex subunit 10-like protein n=1 Tax=Corchorus capsularis TaxID=210143 RepID=A0A1R3GXK8_COCAP|nr:CCR4-NOT transcription complex subunit 10-like protein [Corchorus capsularis]